MLIGVVGKPNVGKSSFFKAATLAEVEIANYPFTTIKPSHAVGFVKIPCVDKEFGKQCEPKFGYCLDSIRFIPVDMLDVAGLVPGAHLGKGLGLSFLDDLREADAFIHIIDASGSTNEKGEPVEPLSYDPCNDVRFLEVELDMWILGILKKGWERFVRRIIQENLDIYKALAEQLSGLKIDDKKVDEAIKKLGIGKDPAFWREAELKLLANGIRKISKPMIIAANKIDIPGADKNLQKLRENFPDHLIIPCSAESELALREAHKSRLIHYIPGSNDFKILDRKKITDNQIKALEFIKNNIISYFGSTGVQEILDKAVFELLGCVVVFPVENENRLCDSKGKILPDAHIMPNGSTAMDLANKIHTDIADHFSCAVDARTKKRLSRGHKLKNRDIIRIMIQ